MELKRCAECGADLNGKACLEYFNKMLAWDFADFAGVGQVHHLTVLCYYLQHPGKYSTEGLKKAIGILKDVLEGNLTDKDLYREESEVFSSSKRTWKVSGTPENHGVYSPKVKWTLTVSDVVQGGLEKYPENVRKWAQLIYKDLKASGNTE